MINKPIRSLAIILLIIAQLRILQLDASAGDSGLFFNDLLIENRQLQQLTSPNSTPLIWGYSYNPVFNYTSRDYVEKDIYLLADDSSYKKDTKSDEIDTKDSNRNRFDKGKMHKYLGFSSILLAGLAAVTSSEKSVHYAAAYTASGTSIAACALGFMEYRDHFDLSEGIFSRENLHILLGTLGTLGITAAVITADSDKETHHGRVGGIGAVSMAISIIVIKW